jgi:glycosyltransferase involved in cell wall biosynthesis
VLAQSEIVAYRQFVSDQVVVSFPNGIDLATYRDLRRPPSEMSSPLNLLYVGRLARDKGLFEALQGLALAHAHGVAATLVVAGSGPDEQPLKALVEQLGLGRTVSFVGPVFDKDKLDLFGRADALVFPTYAEGLPYVLLESMAAGVPAITTRVGGIPDVMIEGIHGMFVQPRNAQAICDAIIRLSNDRALLTNMRDACRSRIANGYSIDRLAGEFARLYRELCPSRPAGLLDKS